MISLFVISLVVSLDGGTHFVSNEVRADVSPARYETVVFLTGDLAAAIPIAAERLLGPQKRATDCLDQLQSFRVHVSRDDDVITVVFRPNTRCGEGIKGGGGKVRLDAKTLRVISSKGNE